MAVVINFNRSIDPAQNRDVLAFPIFRHAQDKFALGLKALIKPHYIKGFGAVEADERGAVFAKALGGFVDAWW